MTDKALTNLLRSSLPLEHEVAMIAHRAGYFNNGEFSYSRLNEHGRPTDFSVDLLVAADLSTVVENEDVDKYLNVLLECKYASPSVAWIFSTAPKHEPMVMTGFSFFQWLGTHLLYGLDHMQALEPKVYCTRGVSLSNDSADPKQIRHGLQQLRYAVPRLLESLCDYCYESDASVIPIISPVLVTNAPLLVLKENLTLASMEHAQSIQEIAVEYEHISVYQKAGPELTDFCRSSATTILKKLKLQADAGAIDLLTGDLIDAVESDTVISMKHLPNYLSSLKESISNVAVVGRESVYQTYADARKASSTANPDERF